MSIFFTEPNQANRLPEKKSAILLLNLGSPDAPDAPSLRRYLREFLSDQRVVEMPAWKWQPILRTFILPRRPAKSAEKYRTIWLEEGSPLIVHSQNQAKKLQQALNAQDYPVNVYSAMTYGNPSVADVLLQMKKDDINHVITIPLFPQYAASCSGAALDSLWRALLKTRFQPAVSTVSYFYDFAPYIQLIADNIRHYRQNDDKNRMLIFSFHGIPEAHHLAEDPYYYHCQASAKAIANTLALKEEQYCVSFQSRFGKDCWIGPSTQDILPELARKGVENIDIICPGFLTDCLETLEEIALEGKELFEQAGGKQYRYIPCPNDSHSLIEMLYRLVLPYLNIR